MGAVAQKIILAKAQNRIDHAFAVDGDAVNHGIGQPQQRHGGGHDLFALRLPFRGDGRGQLCVGKTSDPRAGVLTDLPSSKTAKPPSLGATETVFVETLHLFFLIFFGGKRIAPVVRIEAQQLPALDHVRRQRRGRLQPPAIRTADIDAAGMQMQLVGNVAAPARLRAAIFEVADNGRSQAGQMHADLVRASGDGPRRHPGEFHARCPHHGIFGEGKFSALLTFIRHGHALVFAAHRLPWPAPP